MAELDGLGEARKCCFTRCRDDASCITTRECQAVHSHQQLAHRKLIVWQRSLELAFECQRLSTRLPASERFELASQLRTAAASVYANIAEGTGRRTRNEFAHFLSIARGSAMEVDSHTEYAMKVGYLQPAEVERAQRLAGEVVRMLSKMMSRLAPFQ